MIEETDRDNSGAIDFRWKCYKTEFLAFSESCFDIIILLYLLTFSREFCSLMVKREREKETVEDIKQAFRVFDKVCSPMKYLKMKWVPLRMEMAMYPHLNLSLSWIN